MLIALYYSNQLVYKLCNVQLHARNHGRGQGKALKVYDLNGAWLSLHDRINKRLEVVRSLLLCERSFSYWHVNKACKLIDCYNIVL